jgi:hypothetical protein
MVRMWRRRTKACSIMTPSNEPGAIGELMQRITADVKTIARGELDLVVGELVVHARRAAGEAALVVLGGVVALLGVAMSCTAAVFALGAWIPSLAARLLIMAGVYVVLGGAIAVVFARRLAQDIRPNLSIAGYEVRRTVAGATESLFPS